MNNRNWICTEIYRSKWDNWLEMFEHWMRLSFDTERKICIFFFVINTNGSCNRLCNCLVSFCIVWTYRFIIINPGVFPGFVCLIYELVSAFNFKLVNGLSRDLYLSTSPVVYRMLFPVHFAIYSYHMGLKISKMTEVCSFILHVFCFKFDKEIHYIFLINDVQVFGILYSWFLCYFQLKTT